MDPHSVDMNKSVPPTIAELVVSNSRFSTLLAAVKAAGLVDTLSGPGPFTVFAPTNLAFEKVRSGLYLIVKTKNIYLQFLKFLHTVACLALTPVGNSETHQNSSLLLGCCMHAACFIPFGLCNPYCSRTF